MDTVQTGLPASGIDIFPTRPPSRHGITHNSGLSSGFRSLHGCGAAGDLNSSSLASGHKVSTFGSVLNQFLALSVPPPVSGY